MKLQVELAIRRSYEVEAEDPNAGRDKAKELMREELAGAEMDIIDIETENVDEIAA